MRIRPNINVLLIPSIVSVVFSTAGVIISNDKSLALGLSDIFMLKCIIFLIKFLEPAFAWRKFDKIGGYQQIKELELCQLFL